jgi:hypothetical protein
MITIIVVIFVTVIKYVKMSKKSNLNTIKKGMKRL